MGGLLRFWFRHGGVRSAARKVAIVFVVKWRLEGPQASGQSPGFRRKTLESMLFQPRPPPRLNSQCNGVPHGPPRRWR